jgi:hypothetical protein
MRLKRTWALALAKRTATVGVGTLIGALFGLLAASVLPDQMLNGAKPIITSVISLIAGLLALVLGLLVWTAHSVYTNQQSEVYALGNAINRLVFLLRRLGPQGSASLAALREETLAIRRRYWAEYGVPIRYNYEMSRRDMALLELSLGALKPEDDEEKRIVSSCLDLASRIVDSQLTMMRQLRNPTPTLLLDIVTAWATALFFGFGCLSAPTAAAIVAAAIGSMAVAAAVALILELEQPYVGVCVVTPAGIDALLRTLSDTATSDGA